MSKKPLYILTENLSFFYRLKKELDRNTIKYKILNIGGKIPTFYSIILSTSVERTYYYDEKNDIVIFPYLKTQNFEQYVMHVIAACRVGFKNYYSNLTFSIDPGTKYIGVATFLDDYYLESHTLYTKGDAIAYIVKISKLLQLNDSKPLDLHFKFGRGVLGLSYELIKELFFKLDRQNIKHVYLIDEISSSKIRLIFNNKKLPKHESAALLLALREGLPINDAISDQVFDKIKLNHNKTFSNKSEYSKRFEDYNIDIKKIAEAVINDDLSLKEAMNIINDNFKIKGKNLI